MSENDVLSAKEWIEKAPEDLKMAEYLLKGKFFNGVCFHSQQALEKILKAFLIFHKITPKKVHTLVFLLKECSRVDSSLVEFMPEIKRMDRFYIAARYPQTKEFNNAEAQESFRVSGELFAKIKERFQGI